MKICSKCKIEKTQECFSKAKSKLSGIRSQCKECDKVYRSTLNKDKIDLYNKSYNIKNKEKSRAYNKEYRIRNADAIKETIRKNKDIEKIRLRSKSYYLKNKEILNEKSRVYQLKNKEALTEKQRLRKIEKRKNDPLYKLNCNIRRLIQLSLSSGYIVKSKKTTEILGCEIEYFKEYLESKFEKWMNWDNRGLFNGNEKHGWDLDHIRPVSSYVDEKDLYDLNHYTNFQPLCSFENRCIKKDSYE